MYETAGPNFQMDPKTEDLLPGKQLCDGMVVLLEDMRFAGDQPNEDGEFRDESSKRRHLEKDRWCVVTHLERLHNHDQIVFIGVYEDGTKAKRHYGASYCWYVKIDDERSPIYFDLPERDFVQPQPGDKSKDPLFRFVATYDMMGDMKAEPWFDHVFGYHEEAGDIEGRKFLNSLSGVFGIEHVTFTVDMRVPFTSAMRKDPSLVDQHALGVLMGFVNDSDIKVHGFEMLEV